MNGRNLALVAIVLWLATLAVAAMFFVRGNVQQAPDERLAVMLKADERDFVLAEMRMLLEGVQGISAGLAADDMKQVAYAARRIGMASAADVNPALMLKLPLAFKQQGMAVHEQFDRLAEMADGGAAANEVLSLLAEQLSSCVACHASYRLEAGASD